MKKYFAKIPIGLIGLLVAALLDGFLLSWRETRALQLPLFRSPLFTPESPQQLEITLRDTTGETVRWPRFTDAGFTLRYPSDWEVRVLPDQVAGTRIVEFAHSTSEGAVDAAIQVWETWLSSDEDWEQNAELKFWREHGAQENVAVEPVLVNGQPGWRVRALHPVVPGTLAQTVLVGRDGRLYRFRLYLHRDTMVEPYVRVLSLMIGTLRTRKVSPTVTTPGLSESMETSRVLSASPASITVNYNRGAAYAYARTWWNRQSNDDNCYLWYNGSRLDCIYHSGDWGVVCMRRMADGLSFCQPYCGIGRRFRPSSGLGCMWAIARVGIGAMIC